MASELRKMIPTRRKVIRIAFQAASIVVMTTCVSFAQTPASTSSRLSGTWELARSKNHSDRVASYVRPEVQLRPQTLVISQNGAELAMTWTATSRRLGPRVWKATVFTDKRGEKNAVINGVEQKTKTKLNDGKVVIEGSAKGKSGYYEKFIDEFHVSDDGATLTIRTFRSGDVYLHGRQVMIGPMELRLVRTFNLKR